MANDRLPQEAEDYEGALPRSQSNAGSFAASLGDGDTMGLVAQEDKEGASKESGSVVQRPVMQMLLFVSCALCGTLIPLLIDFSKEYQTHYPDPDRPGAWLSCDGKLGHIKECKGKIPYIPTFQMVIENSFTFVVAIVLTAVLSGLDGLRKVVSRERLRLIAPIAFVYAAGDLAALLAIGATSASFFQVVGQTRLLATALMTVIVLKKNQTPVQWTILAILTCSCVLYCNLDLILLQGKGGQAEMELVGLSWALLKVVLGAANSVLTERAFKAAKEEPIWVNQAQLTLCSTPIAVALFVSQGIVFCAEGECAQHLADGVWTGWSWRVTLLVGGQILNNFVVGLVYKYVDAVVKYLAYAQSLWITYIINILMLGVAFHFDMFLIVMILVMSVVAYSLSKAPAAPGKNAVRVPTLTMLGDNPERHLATKRPRSSPSMLDGTFEIVSNFKPLDEVEVASDETSVCAGKCNGG